MAAVLALLVVVAATAYCAARRRRRRRASATMYVVSLPGIELEQLYGGWNAEAYDAGTGHGDRLRSAPWHSGPPSTWGRQF